MNRGIPVQHTLQCRTRGQNGLQFIDVYLKAFSSNLHNRAMRASFEPSGNGNGREPLISHHTNFYAFSLLRGEDQGNHSLVQEVRLFQASVGVLQVQSLGQGHELQMRTNFVEFFLRNRKKNGIGYWFTGGIRPLSSIQRLRGPGYSRSVSFAHSILRVLPRLVTELSLRCRRCRLTSHSISESSR